MEGPYTLQVSASLDNLQTIRDFVARSAAHIGLAADASSDAVLAVDEAATNIIMHGYRDLEGTIEVVLNNEAGDLIIRVRDNATPFDPDSVADPDLKQPLEKRNIGGLGLFLIRHVMDEVSHRELPGGGNELILTKRCAGST